MILYNCFAITQILLVVHKYNISVKRQESENCNVTYVTKPSAWKKFGKKLLLLKSGLSTIGNFEQKDIPNFAFPC